MARRLQGTVVSDKMDKTAVVAVVRQKTHPLYGKKYKVTTKFKAHDEKNEFKVGDVVEITETRPISATKNWNVTKKLKTGVVLEKPIGAEEQDEQPKASKSNVTEPGVKS